MRDTWIEHLLLTLPERSESLVSMRLYGAIREAILQHAFRAGSRLPASRELATGIGVSRNTVTKVFDQLLAEGFVTARMGAGTFVADLDVLHVQPLMRSSGTLENNEAHAGFSLRGSALIRNSSAAVRQWGAFMPGVPDVRLFPVEKLHRRISMLGRKGAPGLMSYPEEGGDPVLRAALAEHLGLVRGVRCSTEHILIVEGAHQGLDLICRLMADTGDTVWIEEPGYWGIRRLLEINGLKAYPIPVDDNGLLLPTGDAPLPKLIFTTPSHHYPLGSVMNIQRRRQLLAFARQVNALIIEDDYDSEFRYSGSPIPSLQSLESNSPVIYVGTFSKTIYPGLRIAYMVLPDHLVEGFTSAYLDLHRGGHGLMQRALGEFIEAGQYARHIRRVRSIYGRRREYLIQLIENHLGSTFFPRAIREKAGLHLVLDLPDIVDDAELASQADSYGVLVRPLSRYYQNSPGHGGLLLGYACVAEHEMEEPLEKLVRCIKRML